jgi:hypothetical protein
MLKGKTLTRVRNLLKIPLDDLERWRLVRATDILNLPGCGKSTLNKLRLYLAHRGISLRDDNPPQYWLDALGTAESRAEAEAQGVCPFTIVIDHNETFPFAFDSIRDRDDNPVSVPIVRRQLWRDGLGDYTIDGMEADIQIERKADDLASSLSERRDAFEAEVARLNDMCEFAAIVCEHSWSDILADSHDHGARAKSISRTYFAWVIRYPGVHWIMCAGRYHAEQTTFRLLERFWWHKQRTLAAEAAESRTVDLFSRVR